MASKHSRKTKAILLFFIFLVAGTTGGWSIISSCFKPAVIVSGSMEPALQVGDVVFTSEIDDYSSVKVGLEGDILVIANYSVFVENGVPAGLYDHIDPSTPIVHRAISKHLENGTWFFITKGDNNPDPDGCLRYLDITNDSHFTLEYNASNPVPVPQEYIAGKVAFSIPFIGYIRIYSPFIMLYLITLIAIAAISIARRRRHDNDEKKIVVHPSRI
jgi:signal peptidase I